MSNEELRRLKEFKRLEVMIKQRKWSWVGHTLRRPADNIARQSLDWNPQGTRLRGRPKITWKRSAVEEAKVSG